MSDTTVNAVSPLDGFPGLEASNLRITYGGHTAVKDFSFSAPIGHITGLLGPNGAGKTTIFNACNGLLRPEVGAVRLFDTDVSAWPPPRRARFGLGRTFQRMELCQAMTVSENVALGREARSAGGNALKQVFCTRKQRKALARACDDAIEICGLGPVADRLLATMSTGQRRLVELARALAGDFRMLLLDEPSSGLDDEETARFGDILRAVVKGQDLGILLVEHDMELVMAVCEYLFVLDFGVLIFAGTPAETSRSEVVRAAYLGEAEPVAAAVGDASGLTEG
jgi:ABC-type branched-subunit amino acid transport system ATPase component